MERKEHLLCNSEFLNNTPELLASFSLPGIPYIPDIPEFQQNDDIGEVIATSMSYAGRIIVEDNFADLAMTRAIVATHKLGFQLTSAGIDDVNPDKSALTIMDSINDHTGKKTTVVISNTEGRPDRDGAGGVSIDVAGIQPLRVLERDQNPMKSILLTGVAGFIGHKTAEVLLERGCTVVGLDNMNDYYDVRLKKYRLGNLNKHENFKFYNIDIENFEALKIVFGQNKLDAVINLAARAGVRYSLENPFVYVRTNTLGTVNLLECCKDCKIEKFVLASTSSLYAGQAMPFKENLPVNKPISPYAASKKGAELMLYTYHFLYGIDATVLRYFTVYGPAGRPDMSIFRFIKWIDEGVPIEIFGDGTQSRDFTYIDDIAEGTVTACETKTGYEIINLGGNKSHELNYAIELIEKYLGKKANRDLKPFHKADLMATWADITKAQNILKWHAKISLEDGIKRTIEWYLANKDWVKDMKMPV